MLQNLTFTDEETPKAALLLRFMGALAQFERKLIRERQREGIALTKGWIAADINMGGHGLEIA